MAIKVRVAVILIKNNKLLCVRHEKKGRSYWVLPGGGVEKREALRETARREIKEEVNLEIEVGNLIFIDEAIPPNRKKHVLNFYFKGEIKGGTLQVAVDERLREAKFFTREEFKELEFFPFIQKEIALSWEQGFQGEIKYLGNKAV